MKRQFILVLTNFSRITFFCLTIILLSQSDIFSQPTLWGATPAGGTDHFGALFKTNSSGANMQVQYEFKNDFPGGYPSWGGHLAETPDGKLYGTTPYGGRYGYGTLFEYDLQLKAYKVLFDFDYANSGALPFGGPCLAMNGKLYGTTSSGGAYRMGIIYEYDLSSNTLSDKYEFGLGIGSVYVSEFIQASNGKLYSTLTLGGAYNSGILFEFDPGNGIFTKKADFDGVNGSTPYYNGLVEGAGGVLFGSTTLGGDFNSGVLFKFDLQSNLLTKVYDFPNQLGGAAGGNYPYGTLALLNGKLYGTTLYGMGGKPGIYEFDVNSNNLSFRAALDDQSIGGVQAVDGKLYGVTLGGYHPSGTIFQFDPVTGIYETKREFNPNTGYYSYACLSVSSSGKLYGQTSYGGIGHSGVVFQFDPATSAYSMLVDFGRAEFGSVPGDLTLHPNGKFYGVTHGGGKYGVGVIFEYDTTQKKITRKADFHPNMFYAQMASNGKLVLGPNNRFYGIAQTSGVDSAYHQFVLHAILFEYDPELNSIIPRKVLDESFLNPQTLTLSPNGKLYGTTYKGGANDVGYLFEYDPLTDAFIEKIDFESTETGTTQTGSMTFNQNGKMYGLMVLGGANNYGTAFEYDAATNEFKKIIDFSEPTVDFQSGMVAHPNGNLYFFSGYLTAHEINLTTMSLASVTDPAVFGSLESSPVFNPFDNKIYGAAMLYPSPFLYSVDFSEKKISKTFEFEPMIGFQYIPLIPGLVFVKGGQSITFGSLSNKVFGSPSFDLSATSTAGLPVSYLSSDPTIASVSGNTITILKAGTVTITAQQLGDSSYNAAQDVQQNLTISKADQVITFNSLPLKTFGDPSFDLNATSTSGLSITYLSQNGKVNIISGKATIVAAGRESIEAQQNGNENYNSAQSLIQSFCIDPAKPTFTQTLASGEVTLTSSTTSGNQWYLNGNEINGATDKTFAAVQAGEYKLQVTADDCESEFSENATVIITGDIRSHESISLFPNPADHSISIKGMDSTSEIIVFDALGKQQSIQFVEELEYLKGDVRHLSAGVYAVRVFLNNQVQMLRFVKQ